MMSNCDDRSPPDKDWFDDSGVVSPPPDDLPLTISNVARMFNVSRLALRNYEVRGLIKRRHRVGSTRVYGWGDCERIAFIIKGRRVGLTLSEMTAVIKAADDDAPAGTVKDGRTKCLELIDRLDRRRQPLREALAELRHLYTLLSTKLSGPDQS
jgi:DNA-binding transcriptional MerR regulator